MKKPKYKLNDVVIVKVDLSNFFSKQEEKDQAKDSIYQGVIKNAYMVGDNWKYNISIPSLDYWNMDKQMRFDENKILELAQDNEYKQPQTGYTTPETVSGTTHNH